MIRRFLHGRGGLWLLMGLDVLILLSVMYLLRDRGWTTVVVFWIVATVMYFANHRIWLWIGVRTQPRSS
jgi:hypothetical protein